MLRGSLQTMVSVRPTVKVLKILYSGDKLPEYTAAAYNDAKRASEPEVKIEYLRQAVEHAQAEVTLVTYIQARFDQGIFERLRSVDHRVFESRDAEGAAWRGAVVHDGGDTAWLVHADTHDHFLAQANKVLGAMKRDGTLGPAALDLRILGMQERLDREREYGRCAMESTLGALKDATVSLKPVKLQVGALSVVVDVETVPFQDWEVDTAQDEVEIVSLRLENWQKNYQELQAYLRSVFCLFQTDEESAETFADLEFVVQIALSRAELIALLDIPQQDQPVALRKVTAPQYLHYSTKGALAEAFITGKAIRAVCGKWWVPIGDEQTHAHLPICPECERGEPVAQALQSYLRKTTDR
ncbi:hypothetical protein GCM10009537_13180 [Corynebacterium riegelii]|nr:DUF3039 domain-containing protein [Corynebacterium riegelii]